MSSRIYFDNNATTSPFEEVVESMRQELLKGCRNPSSVHTEGQQARATLIKARETIAECLNVSPQWIFFTSGGTESMNTLIHAHASIYEHSSSIITSSLEHSCVLEPIKALQRAGNSVTWLTSKSGRIDIAQIEAESTRKNFNLMILSAANSETGILHPLESYASFAQDRKIPLIIDGVALLGKEPFKMYPGITGIGFAAHKFHGPKGIGFCIAKPKKNFDALLKGGPQESGRRAGTENLPAIVGLAEAIKRITSDLPVISSKIRALRDRFDSKLKTIYPDLVVIGQGDRLCNTSALAFPTKDGESLLIALDQAGIAASHGSACSSGSMQPSRVLKEMGLDPRIVKSGIRFSFSRFNTEEEIDEAIHRMRSILA